MILYETPEKSRNGKANCADNKDNIFVFCLLNVTAKTEAYYQLWYNHREIEDAHEQTHFS